MRVLFTTYPEKTVFQYLVPLAWALRTAGHEVVFASQANFADVITQAGLTALPAGANAQPWRVTDLTPEQRRGERHGLPAPYAVVGDPGEITWEYLSDGYAGPVVNRYVQESLPMIPDLVAFARHWQPDLVVWESNCYAGPIAATACGAAHARLLFGIDIFGLAREHYRRLRARQPNGDRPDAVAEWFTAQIGTFDEDMVTGHFTIDQFPASLQIEAESLRYLRMRYVPYGGPAVVPSWLREPPRRPRVALTMGLSAVEHFDGYAVDLQDVLDALSDLDVEVVATVADEKRHLLTRVPDNARIVAYVPLHALVPTCAAVIHHAGAATLATTSLYGVPQLAVHHHFDQPAFAELLAAQGAGISIPAGEATGARVREALLRLLGEPRFAAGAERLRAEMAALPTPAEVVEQLEKLTAEHRTR